MTKQFLHTLAYLFFFSILGQSQDIEWSFNLGNDSSYTSYAPIVNQINGVPTSGKSKLISLGLNFKMK